MRNSAEKWQFTFVPVQGKGLGFFIPMPTSYWIWIPHIQKGGVALGKVTLFSPGIPSNRLIALPACGGMRPFTPEGDQSATSQHLPLLASLSCYTSQPALDEGQDLIMFPLHFLHTAPCLAHSRHSTNLCWINHQRYWAKTNFLSQKADPDKEQSGHESLWSFQQFLLLFHICPI